ncbi:AAA family ATPase [Brevibacterium luteolum]|uniref:AAA family ATPase n=1 Tax=Brevibacterium luteolum TaxID=199591 RepID=A0A849AYR3_9MICO|nr:AAA family ATPase [Brevibacterium luteolum]MBM7528087.1 wobble nucleotide-excising tRNase [Brevibacterium luteolum]NNG78196.1 AAA family ATPase [Brevibacterium luteolum]
MLTKILNVEGVGLLRRANGGARHLFGKNTLLYAENGRGKSTLSSVLTSCATRDTELIEDRITIGGQVQPAAKLLFESALAEYKNGSWSGYTPEILVYDGHFVNSNVHTGNEITSNQRANLLDFALGSSAVKARQREQKATLAEKRESSDVKEVRQKIEALLAGKMAVPQFRALKKDTKIDQKIARAEKRLSELVRSADIKRQPIPEQYEIPKLNIGEVVEVLNSTLESVHAKAAAKVSDHLASLKDANSAAWIRQGLDIANDDQCPFCGQDTSAVDLLDMYKIYFDQAYTDLQQSVGRTARQVLERTDLSQIGAFAKVRTRNNEILEQWKDYIRIPNLDDSQDEFARLALENLRESLESLFLRKEASLGDACVEDSQIEDLQAEWDRFTNVYKEENQVILSTLSDIGKYKKNLDASSLDEQRDELDNLRLVKLRYDADTVALLSTLSAAETSLKNARKAKKEARGELDQIMKDTLIQFKDTINDHLAAFNAEFRIAEFNHNYLGQAPRVEYQIRLRGESIELSGGRPTFATALSEGDKKTMGFAFFAASTLADPDLGEKIVVIDDPMSSLDAPRREHTMKVIEQISGEAKQLILMAHDGHFLRGVRDRLLRSGDAPDVTQVSLRMSSGHYSDIGLIDLDALCQSDYLRNYKLVSGVVSGELNGVDDVKSGAIALRPLLEGYLHRKYPEVIPTGVTLGSAITAIEDSSGSDSPCAAMASRVEELREMNAYASRFHHETQPDYVAAQCADHREVANHGKRILEFIHSA